MSICSTKARVMHAVISRFPWEITRNVRISISTVPSDVINLMCRKGGMYGKCIDASR